MAFHVKGKFGGKFVLAKSGKAELRGECESLLPHLRDGTAWEAREDPECLVSECRQSEQCQRT